MITQRVATSTIFSVLAFAGAGAVSRFALRSTETRYQIVAFAIAAAGLELLAAATRLTRPSWLRGVANALAATVVIITVKFHLEPVAKAQDVAAVRHVARKINGNLTEAR